MYYRIKRLHGAIVPCCDKTAKEIKSFIQKD
nr:MAG TPA: hypothetical protein [Caudoviricetes sp.]